MPEGHTIHRRARDHTRWFAGQRLLVSSPQGRFDDEASHLDGRRFEGAEAWGKHLFHHYEHGHTVHIHLGLIGRFRMRKAPVPEPRGAIRMRLVGDERGLDLVGPMVCRLLRSNEVAAVTAGLGPDPLRDDGDPDRVWQTIASSRRTIGGALMDQAVIAGVGNVYRAELLLRAGIHPSTRCKDLTRAQFDALWSDAAGLLALGVKLDRIVTVDADEVDKPLARLRRGERTYLYKKKTCGRCGGPVRRWTLSGRVAYACEACQPPPG